MRNFETNSRPPAGWNDSESLETHLLGLVDFESALNLQERIVYELGGRGDRLGCLLVCEHPPEISLGRDASRRDVLARDEDLEAREIPVRWVARGGGAVVHAPGQLAVYPLLPLDRLGLGVDGFRRRVESALMAVCHELRIAAKRRDDEPGVWTRYGQVAFVGAAVKSWVSCHGAFLNVTVDPGFLRLAAATPGQPATTLQSLRLRPVSMNQVREAVIRQIAAAFDYHTVHTYVGHPLLQRTRRRICTHA
jgi:lipoyl(octanoyl) transferase